MKSNRRADQSGFTLIELLVVVTLMAIVATALAASITVFLRNEGSVSTRLTDTRDLQNLTNYLPGDVASAQSVESNLSAAQPADGVSASSTLCGTGTAVLLHLEWSENWTASHSSRVTYWLNSPAGPNGQQLVRSLCVNTGSAETVSIAEAFQTVSVDLQRSSGDLTGTVEVSFGYPDGETKRVTATSRHFLP